jgi:hypothetical protein
MFAPAASVYTGGGLLAVGDFNRDGKADLLVNIFNSSTRTLYNGAEVLFGNGSGGFSAAPGSPFEFGPTPPTGVPGFSVAVGDFNSSGRDDLAVTSGTTSSSAVGSWANAVMVFLGFGNGQFSKFEPFLQIQPPFQ